MSVRQQLLLFHNDNYGCCSLVGHSTLITSEPSSMETQSKATLPSVVQDNSSPPRQVDPTPVTAWPMESSPLASEPTHFLHIPWAAWVSAGIAQQRLWERCSSEATATKGKRTTQTQPRNGANHLLFVIITFSLRNGNNQNTQLQLQLPSESRALQGAASAPLLFRLHSEEPSTNPAE